MKLKSTADGLFGEQVNPYEQYIRHRPYIIDPEWQEFEATKVKLPLVKQMPGNTVFEGVEVWQYQHPFDGDKWFVLPNDIQPVNDEYNYRRSYQPLEVKEQVREEAPICKECNCAYDSDEHLVKCNRRDKTAPFDIKTITPKASNPELGVEAYTLKKDQEYKDAIKPHQQTIDLLKYVKPFGWEQAIGAIYEGIEGMLKDR